MNHIFRVVFNKSKGVFVAVSELVKSHGKEKSEQGTSGLSPIFTKGFALNALFSAVLLGGFGLFVNPALAGNNLQVWGSKIANDGNHGCAGTESVNLSIATGPASGDVACLTASKSVVIGYGVQMNNAYEGGTLVGHSAETNGLNSTAFGRKARAGTTYESSRGGIAIVAQQATAVGYNSLAFGNNAVALGTYVGTNKNGVVIGNNSYAQGAGSIAIGGPDLTDGGINDKLPNETIISIFAPLWNKTTGFFSPSAANGGVGNNTNGFANLYGGTTDTDDRRVKSPTYAGGIGSIAIGSRSVAAQNLSTALGSLSFALAEKSTAVGIRAYVSSEATGGTAIGELSRVFAGNSVAIGNLTESSNAGTVSYGYKAYAVGQNSIAIGNNVAAATRVANSDIINAYGLDSSGSPTPMSTVKDSVTSYFDTKFSTQKESTVYLTVGSEDIKKSTAQGANAIVLGNSSLALKENGVAVGYGSLVDAQNSISVGSYNYIKSGSDNALVVGLNNRILGNSSQSQNNTVIGSGNVIGSATGDSLVLGSNSKLGSVSGASLTLGKGVSIGDNSWQSIAFGQGASIGNQATNAAAIGVSSSIGNNAYSSTAFGYQAKVAAGAYNAIAIGLNSSIAANAHDSAAFGIGASATVASSMALGNQSVASFANSVALGFQSRTDYTQGDYNTDPWTAKGAIATPTSSKTGVISVGSKGQERRITNVASGALNTDAVNVSQLKTIEEKFQTEISSLKQGGGSQYLSIERKHSSGQAGDLAARIAKTDNYQDYVEMRAQLAYLKARKEVNGEIFNQTSYDNYVQAVNELGALYDGAVASTATALTATDQDIANAKGQLSGLNGDDLENKRAELMKSLQTTIANAQAADAGKTMAGALSAAEAEAAKKDTNINNDGALGDDSVALGWKATTGRRIGVNEFGTLAAQFVRNTNGTVDDGKVGNRSIAIGFEAQANGKNAIAIGGTEDGTGDGINTNRNIATGDNSIAIGTGNTVTGPKAIAIGYGHKVTAAGSGAFGDPSIINYSNSYAVGNNNIIGTSGPADAQPDAKVGSFVLGNNVTVTADQVFVLGNGTSTNKLAADTARSVYLGDNTVAIASGTISAGKTDSYASVTTVSPFTFGSFAGATPVGVVTIGSTTVSRRLQGVAAGLIGATSTDAINGSQLYATNAILGKLASSVKDKFGGNAALTTSGTEAGTLTFTNIGGTGKATIDDAIKAVKASVAGTAPITVSSESDSTGATTYTVSLADGGVTTDKLANGAVTADKLANGAVTSDKIADGTIAADDLSQAVKDKIDAGNNAASNTIALKDGSTGSTKAKSLKDGNITFNIKGSNGITTTANGDDITISIDASALPTNPNGGGTGAAHWFNVNTTNTTDTNYDSTNSGAKGTDSIAVGRNVVANGGGTIAIGSDITSESNASTGATNAIVMGVGAGTPLRASAAEKLGAYSIAIGSNAYATQQGASAIGWAASATDIGATALGTRAAASGNKSLAGGFNAQASGASSVALGDTAKATADYSVALGSGSIAGDVNKGTNASSFAMGDNVVAAGSPLVEDNKVAVLSVGNSGGTSVKYRQIQNVAAGVISETSTDAINGSQLFYTNQAVTEAKSVADTAKFTADTAKSAAGTAQTAANTAQSTADTAKTTAEAAQIAANTAQTTADAAQTAADAAQSTANATKSTVDSLALSFTTDSEKDGTVKLTGSSKQTLSVKGTNGYISTANDENGQSITISLADGIKNKLDKLADDPNGTYATQSDVDGKAAANASNITGDNLTSWQTALGTISFKGDDDSAIARKLGETLDIKGGATGEVAEGNIKVSNSDGSLLIQLAKTLTGLTSVSADTVNAGSLVLGSTGNTTTLSMNNGALDVGGAKLTNLGAGNVADGSTDAVTGDQLNEVKEAIASASSIHYAATTSTDGAGKSVALTTGLTFLGDGNIDTSIEDGGKVNFALDKTLTGLTSATFGESTGARTAVSQDGVTITPASGSAISLTADGLNNGGKVISNVGNGGISSGSKNAVNGGEVYTALQGKANANQTFALLDKTGTSTATQQLGKQGGIQFKITGTDDVTTTADDAANSITVGVNKIAALSGIVANEAKLVSAGAVYSAITSAKTKLTRDPNTEDNLLELTPTLGTGLAADSYVLKVSKSAVQTMITNSLSGLGNITFKDQLNAEKHVALGDTIKINGQSGWIDAIWATTGDTPTLNLSVGSDIQQAVDKINHLQPSDIGTITYKANAKDYGTGESRTVVNSQGFDFRGAGTYDLGNDAERTNKNVLVSIEPSSTGGDTAGVVNFSLADDLTGVNSIAGNKTEGSATDDAAKITLTPKGSNDKATVDVNDAQIAGVADGKIADNSDNAVTGKQLADLAEKLGLVTDNGALDTTADGTGFNDLTLDKIGTNSTAPSNVVEAVKQLTTAANGGLTFGADKGTASPVALGKKLSVVHAGTVITDHSINYAGTNLRTKVTAADGTNPAKIEIGLSEKPNFDTVTVGNAAGTVGAGVTLSKTDDGDLKLGSGAAGNDAVKLTNLAAGSVAADSKDAVTGAQLASLKDILGSNFTVDDAGNIVAPSVVNGTNGAPATGGIGGTGKSTVTEAIAEAVRLAGAASGTTLVYRAKNDSTTSSDKSVVLSNGLTFTGGTNTEATVKDGGIVTFDVKPQLSGITEIKGAESVAGNNDAATISLKPKDQANTATVDVNGAKVSGIAASAIATDGKDAVTTGQLKDLADQLGIAPNTADTKKFSGGNPLFSTPIGSNKQAPTTLKGAVDQLIGSVNGGLTFMADNAGTSVAVGLGKKLSVVHAGTVFTDDSINYAGTNLRTKVTAAEGANPAKIEIGLSEKPNFATVTVGNAAGTAGEGVTLSKTTDGDLKLGSGADGNTAVKLTNLAAGSLADASKDAVTGDQLHDVLNKLKEALGSGFTLDDNGNITPPAATASNGNKAGIGGTGKTSIDAAIQDLAQQVKNNASANANAALTVKANGAGEQHIALTNGLDFVDGTNTTTSVDADGKVKVELNSELKKITSISAGDNTNATTISLAKDKKEVNLNTAKLTGLDKGEVKADSTDAVTGGQLYEVKQSVSTLSSGVDTVRQDITNLSTTVDNVSEKVNKGIQITTNGDDAQKVQMGNTINVKDGVNTKVSAIESKDGMFSYSINVNGIPMSYVNSQGETLAKIGDAFVVVNPDGSLVTDLDMSKPENVARVKPAGVKLVNTTEANKPMSLDNVANGSIASGSQQAVNGGQVADLVGAKVAEIDDGQGGKKTVIVGGDGKGVGSTGAKTISEAVKVVNDKATNAETVANEAKEIAKNATATEIVGDTDSGVIVEKKDNASGNGKSYTVKLGNKVKTKEVEADKVTAKEVVADKVSAKQVDTDLITLGGGKVSMIAGEDDDGVSVLAVGSEKAPTRIRGIADGVAPTDAVNMRQFGEVTSRLGKQINKVSRTANAGIAGAMAMTGLPQASDPGSSMVSMAGSSFKGESAMAFGVSRRSDNGKFVLKANGSVNSQGDTGVTVGVGYQWR